MTPAVSYREQDGVGFLQLDDPPKNTLNRQAFHEMRRLTRDVLPGAEIRGLIVHGSGRHFSCGADLDELLALLAKPGDPREAADELLRENIDSFLEIEHLPYPTVAAIGGCCLGAGLELALACRYRIATPHALFALPETQLQVMPGCGGTIRLTKLVKPGKAIELILTGRGVLADEARQIGLIDRVVARGELLPAAVRVVRGELALRSEGGHENPAG